jgi:hypothetical protein
MFKYYISKFDAIKKTVDKSTAFNI